MKIEYNEAISRFTEFMADNVAKVPDLGRRFLMYAALGAMNSNPDVAGARLGYWLRTVGILDGEGMVDVDSVEDALAGAFSKVPKVQFAGFTFTSEDAKTLMAKMRA